MNNSTVAFYFSLTMFVDMGHYRYLAFGFCLLLYSFIVIANLAILLVILRQRTLHEPMYIFVAFLSFNSLYGSAGFFPRFLMDLLSDTHLISRSACFTQIYVIYTYASSEMTLLCIMAYDRYVAVCYPLRYHRKMNSKTVFKLAVLAWLFPGFSLLTAILLSLRLPLCGSEIKKIFCANWNVVKLSCVTTVANSIYGLFITIVTVFFPLLYVMFTYLRIIAVCWKGSAEFKRKVFQSCLPHVVTFVIFSITGFCDVSLSRYNIEEMNPFVAVILSLEFVLIPPVLNPLLYGLRLPKIRQHILRMLS